MIIFLLSYIKYNIRSESDLKSAIIVKMDSHLDSQNFVEYGSAYGSYKSLMESHLDPPGSDSNPIH
jgi:hypothetical protein